MTISVNCDASVSPPPAPVTVIAYDPQLVEDIVVIVSVGDMVGFGVTVQVGAPPQPTPPLNPGVAPLGSPLTESVTGCVDPVTSVTVIVLEPELPGLTVIPPLSDKEKSKLEAGLSVEFASVPESLRWSDPAADDRAGLANW